MVSRIRAILLLLCVVTVCILIALLGCDSDKDNVTSEPIPTMETFGNYFCIGNAILNRDYIVRIPEPTNLTPISGRKVAGYTLYAIMQGSTASGFLGGSPTLTKIKLYYGTKENCVIVLNQIKELMKEV